MRKVWGGWGKILGAGEFKKSTQIHRQLSHCAVCTEINIVKLNQIFLENKFKK